MPNLPSPDALQVALTCCTLLAFWIGWAKVARPRVRDRWNRILGFFQAIAGRDPIVDKASGKEISPAVPPLGERLASIDDTMLRLVTVIESNQDAHKRIDNHELRIGTLETREEERREIRAESTEIWRAVANHDIIDVEATDE